MIALHRKIIHYPNVFFYLISFLIFIYFNYDFGWLVFFLKLAYFTLFFHLFTKFFFSVTSEKMVLLIEKRVKQIKSYTTRKKEIKHIFLLTATIFLILPVTDLTSGYLGIAFVKEGLFLLILTSYLFLVLKKIQNRYSISVSEMIFILAYHFLCLNLIFFGSLLLIFFSFLLIFFI